MATSELLKLATSIAQRLERQGQQIAPEDAIARARAAEVQAQKLHELIDEYPDWANAPLRPLPAGVSFPA